MTETASSLPSIAKHSSPMKYRYHYRPRAVVVLAVVALTRHDVQSASIADTKTSFEPSMSFTRERPPPVAILVALEADPPGKAALSEWGEYVTSSGTENLEVFILCTDSVTEALVEATPNVKPFLMTEDSRWETMLQEFSMSNSEANMFGLLGEGVLPRPDLAPGIASVDRALAGSETPTAILSRSRARGCIDDRQEDWLPDTFIAQMWLSREILEAEARLDSDADGSDLTLLEALPLYLRAWQENSNLDLQLVDGTSVLLSILERRASSSKQQQLIFAGNTAAANGGRLYIGSLGLALVRSGDETTNDGRVDIMTAPWPPEYILETVANEDGMVIVNNVNCGYLDFATNFLQSVQRVSDAQVLWIAMDEVAFDFMDDLAPGCAAMFPQESSERHHAIKAGVMGDATFQNQVLVRPSILQAILAAGYTVLWTDSDMVWLENPLGYLPDINDPSAAEVMLQHDGNAGNKCTCFMFIKPTDIGKELLVLWKQSIIDADAFEDQIAFRPALVHQQDAGLRLDIFPVDKFPAGKQFFDLPYEDNYVQLYHRDVIIVHNNWIKGHSAKLQRFKKYHLWGVEGVVFPECGRR